MGKQIYGIVGHPVGHSLSPAMHNAAFKALGIDAEYHVYDVAPDMLENFLNDISYNKISGLNVTIPHKIKVKDYIESHGDLDENARRLGAVNTIRVEKDGRICGFNTDGPGFYRSLVEDLGFEPEGKTVFVLGAGGASRAVIMYLGNSPKKIFVSDIDKEKTKGLKNHYKKYYDEKKLSIANHNKIKEALLESDILINATPMGMRQTDPMPVDKSLLHPGIYIYDLVYNIPATNLVKEATRLKLHAVTGSGMLLYQGAIAFEIWTGCKAPVDVMRKALKDAIKERVLGARH